MPLDKTQLGTRYTCFSCGTKFYDLNRPEPTCPECDTNQADAPVQDLKALLARSRRPLPVESNDSDLDDSNDDDDGLFDSTDDDDDDDGGGDDDDDDDMGPGDDDD